MSRWRAVLALTLSVCSGLLTVAHADAIDSHTSARWHSASKPFGAVWFDSASCGGPSLCAIGTEDGTVVVLHDSKWKSTSIGPYKSGGACYYQCPVVTTCPSPKFCLAAVAYGSEEYTSTFNGLTWTKAKPLPHNLFGNVSCASPSFCVLADVRSVATFNGRTWEATHSISLRIKHDVLVGVDCVTSTFCLAFSAAGEVTTYNGRSWSALQQPLPPIDPQGCLDSGDCAIGPESFSCAQSGICEGFVDQNAVSLVDGRWTRHVQSPSVSGPGQSISCWSVSNCLGFDYNGLGLAYNGTNWRSTGIVDSHGTDGTSMSCSPNGSLCVATDNSGDVWQHY